MVDAEIFIGCHLIQETRVYNVVDDVALFNQPYPRSRNPARRALH